MYIVLKGKKLIIIFLNAPPNFSLWEWKRN